MARHPGAVKRATSYAERLRLGIALIHGDHGKVCESELDDGRNSPPLPEVETRTTAYTLGLEYLPGMPLVVAEIFSAECPLSMRKNQIRFFIAIKSINFPPSLAMAAKEKPPINVVGDVGGRIAIVVVSI